MYLGKALFRLIWFGDLQGSWTRISTSLSRFQKFSTTVSFLSLSLFFFCLFCFFVFVLLFRAVPVTYGSSQARHQIITAAASLHHSHNNAGSKPCLWPPPQFIATPLSKARDQIHVLLDTWVHYYWATTGIPSATISLNKLSALFSHSSFGAPLIRKVVIWMIFHRSHRLSSFFFLHSSLTA